MPGNEETQMIAKKLLVSLAVSLAISLPLRAQTNGQSGPNDGHDDEKNDSRIEPNAGTWQTWVISSGRDYHVPPPRDGRRQELN
jgi:hypothetical protein